MVMDTYTCIELMMQNGVGEGGRNNALFHYGVYAKSKWPQMEIKDSYI